MPAMDKDLLRAVDDDGLRPLLEQLGVLDQVVEATVTCKFCREPVSFDNLAAIFPESNEVKFVCSEPDCIDALLASRAELRGRDLD